MGFCTILQPLLSFSNICGLGPYGVHIEGQRYSKNSFYPFFVLVMLLLLQTFITMDLSGTTANAESVAADMMDTHGFAVTCLGSFIAQTLLSTRIHHLFDRILELHRNIESSPNSIVLHITGGIIYEIVFAFISIAVNPFENSSLFFYVLETLTYVALEITSYAIFLQFTQSVLACHQLFTALNSKLSLLLIEIHDVTKYKPRRYVSLMQQLSFEHAEISDICHTTNELFAIQNLFSVLLILMQLSYATYNGFSNWQENLVDTFLWAGYFLYKLLIMLSVCSTTVYALENFSLQLLHETPFFDAMGFFPLDFTLLYSMIAAVTGYLIILVQFTTA